MIESYFKSSVDGCSIECIEPKQCAGLETCEMDLRESCKLSYKRQMSEVNLINSFRKENIQVQSIEEFLNGTSIEDCDVAKLNYRSLVTEYCSKTFKMPPQCVFTQINQQKFKCEMSINNHSGVGYSSRKEIAKENASCELYSSLLKSSPTSQIDSINKSSSAAIKRQSTSNEADEYYESSRSSVYFWFVFCPF